MATGNAGMEVLEGEEMGWCKKQQKFVPISELKPDRKIMHGYVRIPLTWLRDIRELPAASMLVSGVLWYLSGTQRSATVSLGNSLLRELGVNRFAKYRGLHALEKAGLVTANKNAPGHKVVVTIHHPEAGK